MVSSAIFTVVTQASHLNEITLEVAQGNRGIMAPGQGGRCQALSSINYHPDSFLWTVLTGGLNLQSVHHLLPCVYSWRLRKIWPILRERLAEELNIVLPELPSVWAAYLEYILQLRRASTQAEYKSD
jgi:fatty acid desaturase